MPDGTRLESGLWERIDGDVCDVASHAVVRPKAPESDRVVTEVATAVEQVTDEPVQFTDWASI